MTIATIPARAVAVTAPVVTGVTSRTLLKAIDYTATPDVYLTETGREGWFVFRSGNYASLVTADTQEGIYIASDLVATSSGAWVRSYSGLPSVKWFGAKGDNSNADLTGLQAATDLCKTVFIPEGIYRTNNPWLLDDDTALYFESRGAEISSTSSSAIIRARGHTTSRNFHITIYSGRIRGSGTSGPVGLQFRSASMVKVYGTQITQCNVGIENGGSGALGAFYNEYFGVDITTVTTGIRNGTFGNEIKVFGGRVTDCVVGTDDDDNSGVLYDGLAVETFTGFGGRVSNSGAVADKIRHTNCRFENPSTSGDYASAIALRWAATSQNCRARDNQIITVATGVSDGGTANQSSGN